MYGDSEGVGEPYVYRSRGELSAYACRGKLGQAAYRRCCLSKVWSAVGCALPAAVSHTVHADKRRVSLFSCVSLQYMRAHMADEDLGACGSVFGPGFARAYAVPSDHGTRESVSFLSCQTAGQGIKS